MLSKELELAEKMADAGRSIIMSYFRQPFDVETKEDLSPVTVADKQTEQAMRDLIGETFPEHGVIGEEFDSVNPEAEFVWVLDPIDGTKSFVAGVPLFGSLIALLRNGTPVIGIIDAPAQDERWIGCEGRATTFNGDPVRTRNCHDIGDAWLYATSPDMFEGGDLDSFQRIYGQSKIARFGIDCYAYGLLANGTCDLIVEASMEVYDYCALVPVVMGAGGFISDWQGQPLGLDSDGRILAAGDKQLHLIAQKHLLG